MSRIRKFKHDDHADERERALPPRPKPEPVRDCDPFTKRRLIREYAERYDAPVSTVVFLDYGDGTGRATTL